MAITLSEVLAFIRNPSLNSSDRTLIVEALHSQVRAKRSQAKAGLRPGMRVTFFSNHSYREVTGVIRKVNRVNVDLVEDVTGAKWRVSPQLLNPVVAKGTQDAEGDEF